MPRIEASALRFEEVYAPEVRRATLSISLPKTVTVPAVQMKRGTVDKGKARATASRGMILKRNHKLRRWPVEVPMKKKAKLNQIHCKFFAKGACAICDKCLYSHKQTSSPGVAAVAPAMVLSALANGVVGSAGACVPALPQVAVPDMSAFHAERQLRPT